MITKVKLINWKTHENTELEFDRGINLLVGIIGSGKTSVMDGICFGLFGTFPDLQNRKIKLDDVIMKKPVVKNKAEVLVEFESEGNKYSVKRVIERGKGSTYAELRENGKLIEVQSSQRVTEIIEKKLKISYELFSKIIYSKQNAIDYFLTIPRGKRMKQLDEILLIDKFERARSSVVSLINRISDRIEEKEIFLGRVDLKEIRNSLNKLQLEIERMENEKMELEMKLGRISKERIQLEESIKKIKEIKEIYLEKTRELEVIESSLRDIKERFKKLVETVHEINLEEARKRLSKISKNLREEESEFSQLRERQLKIQSQLAKSETEKKLTEEKISKLESEISELIKLQEIVEKLKKKYNKSELEKKEKALDELKNEINKNKIEISNIREAIIKLSSAESKCPVCGARLTEEKKRKLIEKRRLEEERKKKKLKELENKLKKLEDETKKIREELEKLPRLETKIEDLEKKRKELDTLKSMKKVFEDNSYSLKKELEEVTRIIGEKERILSSLRGEKEKLSILIEKLSEITMLKEKIKQLENKKAVILPEIEKLEKSLKSIDIEKEENRLKNILLSEKEIATRISSIDEILKEKNERKKELEKNASIAEKELKEVNKLKSMLKDLKVLKAAIEATQVDLRSEFITVVNYYMNVLWSSLYPYRDFPAIRLNVEEKDYTLQLQERSGRWINVEGGVSGGERSLAALTMRVAFSLALAPQLKILILDEPTHNLDQKSVEELANTLREKITQFMDQVFIITHDEKLEEAVTGRAYKLEREKEVDGITRITILR